MPNPLDASQDQWVCPLCGWVALVLESVTARQAQSSHDKASDCRGDLVIAPGE